MGARFINEKKLLRMYAAGTKVDVIAARLKCARSTVKANLTRLGVPRRPKGWKPKGHAALMRKIMNARYERLRREVGNADPIRYKVLFIPERHIVRQKTIYHGTASNGRD